MNPYEELENILNFEEMYEDIEKELEKEIGNIDITHYDSDL